MKLINIIIGCVILLVSSCHSKPQEINVLTDAEKSDGWDLLFDGQNTIAWRFFKGGDIKDWKVDNEILCNSGDGINKGGDIITKEKFKDFELYLEWRVDSFSNSGVFYHVEELDSTEFIFETGPEYQLGDDVNFDDPNILCSQLPGANYAMNRPIGAASKPLGEWNKTFIKVQGSHVEHWLNEVKVVEYELWSEDWISNKNASKWKDYPYYGAAKEGHIGLQDHGGRSCFRNIKIKRL